MKCVLTFAAAASLFITVSFLMFAGDGPLHVYLDFSLKHHFQLYQELTTFDF